MKRLTPKQREVYTDYFRKVSLMAAAALIFGQFVSETKIDWPIVITGGFISLTLIIIAAVITKDDNTAFRI